MAEKLKTQYINILTWSDIYEGSSLETRKMIANSLISAIRVSRDYYIEIDFNISIEQFMARNNENHLDAEVKENELAVN